MSTLSELLPSGGGGSTVDFVASGTLPNGKPVILKADGTVEVVSESGVAAATGATTTFHGAGYTTSLTGVYDTSNNKVVLVYTDYPNRYGFAVVGTVSGTSISFGTPVTFRSSLIYATKSAFDSSANKTVIIYRDSVLGDLRSIVGTVSGTSISFGSATQVIGTAIQSDLSLVYDATANRCVAGYETGGNGKVQVGTVSGTSVSWGSAVTVSGAFGDAKGVYDPDEGKTVFAYENGSNYLTAIVGTVSGTTISFGSPVVGISEASDYIGVTYDTTSNKILVSTRNVIGGVQSGAAIVGTVSGTSISFGTRGVYTTSNNYYSTISHDPSANKVSVMWRDASNSQYGTHATGTLSGSAISFEASTVLITATTNEPFILYDPDTAQSVVNYADGSDSNYGKAFTLFFAPSTNLTTSNFVGTSTAAYTNGQTATIAVQGGLSTNQTGLTIGSTYFVQPTGTLATTAGTPSVNAGKALSATTLLLKDL